MHLDTTHVSKSHLAAGILAAALFTMAPIANAAVVSYVATLSGPNESPPNASPAIGTAQVDVDAVAHTMRVFVQFSGLTGTTSACHIHCATALVGSGTAGVATTTPTFAGFPIGVTSGTYDNTLDMTQASSYNPSFVTAHTNIAGAEAFLFQAIADGKAYLNVHSSTFSGGEIRGFLEAGTGATSTSWGRIRSLYR
ncbi:MAG: CHRD domain-containing protein [Candidatus Eisenbacteria bacterium]